VITIGQCPETFRFRIISIDLLNLLYARIYFVKGSFCEVKGWFLSFNFYAAESHNIPVEDYDSPKA